MANKSKKGLIALLISLLLAAGIGVGVYLFNKEPDKIMHTITILESAHGKVETNKNEAFEGEVIEITVTPDEGYELISVLVNGKESELSFVMPDEDVNVLARFTSIENEDNFTKGETFGSVLDHFTSDGVDLTNDFGDNPYIVVKDGGTQFAYLNYVNTKQFYFETSFNVKDIFNEDQYPKFGIFVDGNTEMVKYYVDMKTNKTSNTVGLVYKDSDKDDKWDEAISKNVNKLKFTGDSKIKMAIAVDGSNYYCYANDKIVFAEKMTNEEHFSGIFAFNTKMVVDEYIVKTDEDAASYISKAKKDALALKGDFFGSSGDYRTTDGVDLTNDHGKEPYTLFKGKSPQYAYVNDVSEKQFVFETKVKVTDVLENEKFPKFGLLVNSKSKMTKFYVDMADDKCTALIGVVHQLPGKEDDWKNANTISVTKLDLSKNDITLKVVRDGDTYYYYFNNILLLSKNDLADEKTAVGVFSFNTGMKLYDYSIKVDKEAVEAIDKAKDDVKRLKGDFFGSYKDYKTTISGVDLYNDHGDNPYTTFFGVSPEYAYVNDAFTKKFAFETDINVTDILENEQYPKFGMLINSSKEMNKFYIDMNSSKSVNTLGVVKQLTGKEDDWENAYTTPINEINLEKDSIKLKLVKDNTSYYLYLNDKLVIYRENALNDENTAVGFFSFNTGLKLSKYSIKLDDKANDDIAKAKADALEFNHFSLSQNYFKLNNDVYTLKTDSDNQGKVDDVLYDNKTFVGKYYSISGKLSLTDSKNNGQSRILISSDPKNEVLFALENINGNYQVFTMYKNNEEDWGHWHIVSRPGLNEFNDGEINFEVVVIEGDIYLLINDEVYYKYEDLDIFKESTPKFASYNTCTTSLSNLKGNIFEDNLEASKYLSSHQYHEYVSEYEERMQALYKEYITDLHCDKNVGGTLLLGSSTIDFWGYDVYCGKYNWQKEAGLTFAKNGYNVGIGGTCVEDFLTDKYFDLLIKPFNVDRYVIFLGGNNIEVNGDKGFETAEELQKLLVKIHELNDKAEIYYIYSMPTPSQYKDGKYINEEYEAYIEESKKVIARNTWVKGIDTFDILTTADHKNPKDGIWKDDGVHMNEDGYRIWSDYLYDEIFKGETFGVTQDLNNYTYRYKTTNGVDLYKDKGENASIYIFNSAPQYAYVDDAYTKRLSFETKINVSELLNDDAYPKFGLFINGKSEMVKFFVDMKQDLTSSTVGVVHQLTGEDDDWANVRNVTVDGMEFKDDMYVTLKLVRDGQNYYLYVNDKLVLFDETGNLFDEQGAFGIFSFNSVLTAKEYSYKIDDAALEDIDQAKSDAQIDNVFSLSTNYFTKNGDIYTITTDSDDGSKVDDVLLNNETLKAKYYRVFGTLTQTNSSNWSQSRILLSGADYKHEILISLEYTGSDYQIFTMNKNDSDEWNNWYPIVKPGAKLISNSIDFEIVVNEDDVYLLIDDEIYYKLLDSNIFGSSTLKFSAINSCTTTLSNLDGEIFGSAKDVTDYLADKKEHKYESIYQDKFNALEKEYITDHKCDDNEGGTLLFGDFLIDFWGNSDFAKENGWENISGLTKYVDGYNIGIGGTTVEDWLYVGYDQLISKFDVDKYIIHLGINNYLVDRDQDGVNPSNNLKTLLEKIHTDNPDAKIYYILPIPTPTYYSNGDYNNIGFKNFLNTMKSYCDGKDWLKAIDMSDYLTKSNNCIIDYYQLDNVHLNHKGYGEWFKALIANYALDRKMGTTFGYTNEYISYASVDLTNDKNTAPYVNVSGNGVSFGYLNNVFTKKISYEAAFNIKDVLNGELYPKFGLLLKGATSTVKFYVDMNTDLTSGNVGVVFQNGDNGEDWTNSINVAVEGMKFKDTDKVTLKLVRDGQNYYFYVDDKLVYFDANASLVDENSTYGIFSFNTKMTVSDYVVKVNDDANADIEKALIDVEKKDLGDFFGTNGIYKTENFDLSKDHGDSPYVTSNTNNGQTYINDLSSNKYVFETKVKVLDIKQDELYPKFGLAIDGLDKETKFYIDMTTAKTSDTVAVKIGDNWTYQSAKVNNMDLTNSGITIKLVRDEKNYYLYINDNFVLYKENELPQTNGALGFFEFGTSLTLSNYSIKTGNNADDAISKAKADALATTPFFGSSEGRVTTNTIDLSKDNKKNDGVTMFSGEESEFAYIDSFKAEEFYFETKLNASEVKNNDQYPKFGLFAEDDNEQVCFYFDLNNSLNYTKTGVVEKYPNKDFDWDNSREVTENGALFTGSDYVTLGLLKEGNYLHYFVNGKNVISINSLINSNAIAGVFSFNTKINLKNYSVKTDASTINAKKTLIARFGRTTNDNGYRLDNIQYDYAADTIKIDMKDSNSRTFAGLYDRGIPVEGDSFLVKGKVKIENTKTSGGAASKMEFQVGKSTSDFLKMYIYRYPTNNSIYVEGANSNKDAVNLTRVKNNTLKTGDPYIADFEVINDNGNIYFILDNELQYKYESSWNNIGFSFDVVQYCDVTLSNLSTNYSITGVHAEAMKYEDALENQGKLTDNNFVYDKDANSYSLTKGSSYKHDNVLNDKGNVLDSNYYHVSGLLNINDGLDSSKAYINLEDDNNGIRFVLEKESKNHYTFYTQYNEGDGYSSKEVILPNKLCGSTIRFDVISNNGKVYLAINKELRSSWVEHFDYSNADYFTKSKVTIGGINTNVILMDLQVEEFADSIQNQTYVNSLDVFKYSSSYANRINTLNSQYLSNDKFATGGTLLFGSSTIDYWNVGSSTSSHYNPDYNWLYSSGLKEYENGYNVGIGGTTTRDWFNAYDKLITPFNPSRIVIFLGGNNITEGDTADYASKDLIKILNRLHTDFPDAEIYYIYSMAVPSRYLDGNYTDPEYKGLIDIMKEFCDSNSWVNGISSDSALINPSTKNAYDGYYMSDGIHLTPNLGYKAWSDYMNEVIFDKDYTITWNNYDGSLLATDKVKYWDIPEYKGQTPTKEMSVDKVYTFAKFTPDYVPTVKDATYVATYSESTRKYTITWNNYDNSLLKQTEVEYGTVPEYDGNTPTKATDEDNSYEFDGWTVSPVSVVGDATYTAKFKAIPISFTVKFVDYDDTELKVEHVQKGNAATAPSNPTRSGYTFTGWDKDFSNIQSDLTVKALYSKDKLAITSNIAGFDGGNYYNDGDAITIVPSDVNVKSIKVIGTTSNTDYSSLVTPTKNDGNYNGYKFSFEMPDDNITVSVNEYYNYLTKTSYNVGNLTGVTEDHKNNTFTIKSTNNSNRYFGVVNIGGEMLKGTEFEFTAHLKASGLVTSGATASKIEMQLASVNKAQDNYSYFVKSLIYQAVDQKVWYQNNSVGLTSLHSINSGMTLSDKYEGDIKIILKDGIAQFLLKNKDDTNYQVLYTERVEDFKNNPAYVILGTQYATAEYSNLSFTTENVKLVGKKDVDVKQDTYIVMNTPKSVYSDFNENGYTPVEYYPYEVITEKSIINGLSIDKSIFESIFYNGISISTNGTNYSNVDLDNLKETKIFTDKQVTVRIKSTMIGVGTNLTTSEANRTCNTNGGAQVESDLLNNSVTIFKKGAISNNTYYYGAIYDGTNPIGNDCFEYSLQSVIELNRVDTTNAADANIRFVTNGGVTGIYMSYDGTNVGFKYSTNNNRSYDVLTAVTPTLVKMGDGTSAKFVMVASASRIDKKLVISFYNYVEGKSDYSKDTPIYTKTKTYTSITSDICEVLIGAEEYSYLTLSDINYQKIDRDAFTLSTNKFNDNSGVYTYTSALYEEVYDEVLNKNASISSKYYSFKGTLTNSDGSIYGQSRILIDGLNKHELLIAIENTNDDFQVFAMDRNNTELYDNWQAIIRSGANLCNGTINFEVVVDGGTVYLLIDDKLIYTYSDENITGASNAYVGSYNIAKTTLSNLDGHIYNSHEDVDKYIKSKSNYEYKSNYETRMDSLYKEYITDNNCDKNEGGTLLFGDSIIDFWRLPGYAKFNTWDKITGLNNYVDGYNVGIGGSTIEDWLYVGYDKLVSKFDVDKYIIHIGINNFLAIGSKASQAEVALETLLDKIHENNEDASIYFILPIPVMKDKITAIPFKYNEYSSFKEMAKAYGDTKDYITIVDMDDVLADKDKYAIDEYIYTDNLHLNELGYTKFFEELISVGALNRTYGDTFGKTDEYITYIDVDLSNDKGTLPMTTLNGNGVDLAYANNTANKKISYEASFNVSKINNSETYPKFGITLNNAKENIKFYIDMSTTMTSSTVGVVHQDRESLTENWAQARTATVDNMKFTGSDNVKLKVVLDNTNYYFYVNDTLVLFDNEGSLFDLDNTPGLFSFNSEVKVSAYTIKTGNDADLDIEKAKNDVPQEYSHFFGDTGMFVSKDIDLTYDDGSESAYTYMKKTEEGAYYPLAYVNDASLNKYVFETEVKVLDVYNDDLYPKFGITLDGFSNNTYNTKFYVDMTPKMTSNAVGIYRNGDYTYNKAIIDDLKLKDQYSIKLKLVRDENAYYFYVNDELIFSETNGLPSEASAFGIFSFNTGLKLSNYSVLKGSGADSAIEQAKKDGDKFEASKYITLPVDGQNVKYSVEYTNDSIVIKATGTDFTKLNFDNYVSNYGACELEDYTAYNIISYAGDHNGTNKAYNSSTADFTVDTQFVRNIYRDTNNFVLTIPYSSFGIANKEAAYDRFAFMPAIYNNANNTYHLYTEVNPFITKLYSQTWFKCNYNGVLDYDHKFEDRAKGIEGWKKPDLTAPVALYECSAHHETWQEDVISIVVSEEKGATMVDLYVNNLKDLNKENLEKITHCTNLPILGLYYHSVDGDESQKAALRLAAEAGCAGIDLPGYCATGLDNKAGMGLWDQEYVDYWTNKGYGMSFVDARPSETVIKHELINEQNKFIKEIHELGTKVLISEHVYTIFNEQQAIDFVEFMAGAKNVDIVKLVGLGSTKEDVVNCAEATKFLSQDEKLNGKKFSYHLTGTGSTGDCAWITRIINPAFYKSYVAFCWATSTPGYDYHQLDMDMARETYGYAQTFLQAYEQTTDHTYMDLSFDDCIDILNNYGENHWQYVFFRDSYINGSNISAKGYSQAGTHSEYWKVNSDNLIFEMPDITKTSWPSGCPFRGLAYNFDEKVKVGDELNVSADISIDYTSYSSSSRAPRIGLYIGNNESLLAFTYNTATNKLELVKNSRYFSTGRNDVLVDAEIAGLSDTTYSGDINNGNMIKMMMNLKGNHLSLGFVDDGKGAFEEVASIDLTKEQMELIGETNGYYYAGVIVEQLKYNDMEKVSSVTFSNLSYSGEQILSFFGNSGKNSSSGVDLTHDDGTESAYVDFTSGGQTYVRGINSNRFVFETDINVKEVFNGDAYPKFGICLDGIERPIKFYVDMKPDKTSNKVGIWKSGDGAGVYDYDTSEVEMSFTGSDKVRLKLVRDGNSYYCYVNDELVMVEYDDIKSTPSTIGVFSFNVGMRLSNYSISIGSGANVLIEKVLKDAEEFNKYSLPTNEEILENANKVFEHYSDGYQEVYTQNPTNPDYKGEWIDATFQMGILDLYEQTQDIEYYNFVYNLASARDFKLNGGVNTTYLDSLAYGQVYTRLYELNKKYSLGKSINLDTMLEQLDNATISSGENKGLYDYSWVDEDYMLGWINTYLSHEFSSSTPTVHNDYSKIDYDSYMNWRKDFFDKDTGLWFRDANYIFEKGASGVTADGKKVLWSRGNAWIYTALATHLSYLEEYAISDPTILDSDIYKQYKQDFITMSDALCLAQRKDGFFNANLSDSEVAIGKEETGTAGFVYGLAKGVKLGYLNDAKYIDALNLGYGGLNRYSLKDNGSLGYCQPIGWAPTDYDAAKFKDNSTNFGVGLYLKAICAYNDVLDMLGYNGEGTEEKPYEISNKANFELFANSINNGETFKDKYFILTDDIENVSENITKLFEGTFDGKSNSITLNIKSSDSNIGLFSEVSGSIKNLTIKGTIKYDTDNVPTKDVSVGGVAGKLLSGGSIEGCVNNATIIGTSIDGLSNTAGGIVGICEGNIKNCVNNGNVSSKGSQTTSHWGGIGGIAGIISKNANVTIASCTNNGSIQGTYNVGGIAGYSETNKNSLVKDCINGAKATTKTITGSDSVAGIIGRNNIAIKGCTNYMDVTTTSSYAAGIAGRSADNGNITSSSNYGKITGGNEYTGGIMGCSSSVDSYINDCHNYGDVVGNKYTGGIIGAAYSTGINTGKVDIKEYTSFNIYNTIEYDCSLQYASILNCTNSGNIATLKDGYVGGIAGITTKLSASATDLGSTIIGCVNSGNVNGQAYVGGIVGWAYNNTPTNGIKYSYQLGGTISKGDTIASDLKVSQSSSSKVAWIGCYGQVNDIVVGDVDGGCKYFKEPQEGDEGNPYKISSIADIETINEAVQNGETYAGKYFKLENDIGSADVPLTTMIGLTTNQTAKYFGGTIDGNGKTITISYSGSTAVSGFITCLKGTIKNLTLKGEITNTASSGYTGSLAALMATDAKIINCTSEVNITKARVAGGIAGFIYSGTIDNCINKGNVNGNVSNTNNGVGGIAGTLSNTSANAIKNCINLGNVSSVNYTGGIVGWAREKDGSVIANCTNGSAIVVPTITSTGDFAGGIIGYSLISVEKCNNYGAVSSAGSNVSGIAGYTSIAVTECNDYYE